MADMAPAINSGQDLLPVIRQLENSKDDDISGAGAVGRNQIMLGTAKQFDPAATEEKLKDAAYNDHIAGQYLNHLWNHYRGNTRDVLAAYNAGPTAANRWIRTGRTGGLPEETVNYLDRGSKLISGGDMQKPLPPVDRNFSVPAPQENVEPKAPGRDDYNALLTSGMPKQKADQWRQEQTDLLSKAGMPPDRIASYWGENEPDTSHLDNHVARNLGQVPADQARAVAQKPAEMFAAGLGTSVAGIAMTGGKPPYDMPEHAGIGNSVLQATGQTIGDAPVGVPGMFAGAALGSAIGSAIPIVGTAAGALVGGGIGLIGLPQLTREVMLDYFKRGEIHSAKDFLNMAGGSALRTGKAALLGALTAPFAMAGKAVGGAVAEATTDAVALAVGKTGGTYIGNAIGRGADLTTQAMAFSTAAAGMEGHLPDRESFATGAVMLLGTHLALSALPAKGQGAKLSDAGKIVRDNLQEIYIQTNMPPWEVMNRAATDPVLRQELMQQDVNGKSVIPKSLSLTHDEPPAFTTAEAASIKLVGEGGEGPPKSPGEENITAPEPGPKKVENTSVAPKTADEVRQDVEAFIGKPDQPESSLDPSKMYRQWISELGPARAIDRLIAGREFDPKYQLGLEDMFRQTYVSDTRAMFFVKTGGIDALTLERRKDIPSLMDAKDLFTKSGGNWKGFRDYMIAKRAIDLNTRKLTHGLQSTPEELDLLVKSDAKKYEAANRSWNKTMDAVLDYGRDSGVFSQEQIDAMRRDNPNYVSYRRIMGDEGIMAKKTRGRSFKTSEPVKLFEGDDRQIIDPIVSSTDNIAQIVKMADRNRAIGSAQGLIELRASADLRERLGLKRLKGPKIGDIAGPDSDIFKPYSVENPNAYEAFLATRASRKNFSPNQYLYFRNGHAEVWQATDSTFAELMRGADSPGEANAVVKLFQSVASLQRLGITLDPTFPARISLRHQVTAYLFDPHNIPPFVPFFRGFMHVLKVDGAFDDFVAKGGMGAALVDMDRNVFQKDMQRIFDETGTWDKMYNVFRHPLEASQWVMGRMDAMSRLGRKEILEERGIEGIKAAMNSRTTMLDFTERGTSAFAQGWARIVPFMRPHLLGFKQEWEAWDGNPLGTMAKIGKAVVAAQAILYTLNWFQDNYGGIAEDRKYRNINRYFKDGQYYFPEVGGVRLHLPLPFGVVPRIMGALTVRTLDHFAESDPNAFKEWGQTLLDVMIPPFVPSIVIPPIEEYFNTNIHTGHPVIPARLEGASGPMQYVENTTEPAKAISRFLGSISRNLGYDAGPNPAPSPITIENYTRQWGGALGMAALKALNLPFRPTGEPWSIEDIPFVQSFFYRTTSMNAAPIYQFYDMLAARKGTQTDLRLAKQREALQTGAPGELEQAVNQDQPAGPLENIDRTLRLHQTLIQAIAENKPDAKGHQMDRDEQRQAIDTLTSNMILVARDGIRIMSEGK